MYGKRKRIIHNFRVTNGNKWINLQSLRGHTVPVDFKCKNCGYIVTRHTECFEKRKQICPNCGTKKRSKHTVKSKGKLTIVAPRIDLLDKQSFTKYPWKYMSRQGMSHGEAWIAYFLDLAEIPYETQVTFPRLTSPKGRHLRYDFLVDKEILLEYDGAQHRKKVTYFTPSDNDFIYRERLDKIKNVYAKENSIVLFRLKDKSPNPLNKNLVNCLKDYIPSYNQLN